MDGWNPGGGSRQLGELIDDHGEQLAADLMEIYRVDLRDVLVPGSRVSPLWVLVLVRGLPESSRFVAEVRGGPQFRGWDTSRYALAATVNAVRALQYTYITANSKSKPKVPESFPIPDTTIRKRATGPNTFAAIAAAAMAKAREVEPWREPVEKK